MEKEVFQCAKNGMIVTKCLDRGVYQTATNMDYRSTESITTEITNLQTVVLSQEVKTLETQDQTEKSLHGEKRKHWLVG